MMQVAAIYYQLMVINTAASCINICYVWLYICFLYLSFSASLGKGLLATFVLSQLLHHSGRIYDQNPSEEELNKLEILRGKKKEGKQIRGVVFSVAYLCDNIHH